MSLGIFSPYGRASGETGFLMVLSRYLARRGYGLVQVRCNGCLPQCGRDALTRKGRQVMSCAGCMLEQDRGARWSGMPVIDLSCSFSSADLLAHQETLARHSVHELARFSTEGISVTDICEAELRRGIEDERELRRLLLLAASALNAFSRMVQEHSFDAFLSPAGDDFFLKSLSAVAERRGIRHFRFRWDAARLSTRISGALSGDDFVSSLYFDDVSAMRSDVDTWPDEIRTQLRDVESYLGITQQQLSLPIV